MTEDERVNYINTEAVKHLDDFLRQLEASVITEDQMLAISYASMVTVAVLGFSPEEMATDAAKAVENILNDLSEETDPIVTKCKNKDEDGNCPLHNLHCQYPECEKYE